MTASIDGSPQWSAIHEKRGTIGRIGIRSFDKRHMLFGPAHFCLMEAVNCNEDGFPDFNTLRHRRNDRTVFLYAFDLIEVDAVTYAANQSSCGKVRW